MRRDITYRNYLLDRLGEEESVALERQYFLDHQSFEELLEAEDDLIDSYVRDELEAAERLAFDKRLAALPRWRQRVDAARGIEILKGTPRIASGREIPVGGPQRYMAAAAALLLVLFAAVAAASWWRQRVLLEGLMHRQSRLEYQLRLAREQLDRDRAVLQALATEAAAIPKESPTPRSTAPKATTAVFTLTALTRGSGSNDFVRSSIDQPIILRVPIDDRTADSYGVIIDRVSGGSVWRSLKVPVAVAKPRHLEIEFDAAALPPADYILTITDRTPLGNVLQEYSFRIRE